MLLKEVPDARGQSESASKQFGHVYGPLPDAYMLATHLTGRKFTTGFCAAIVMSLDYRPFAMRFSDALMSVRAVAVRPQMLCQLHPVGSPPAICVFLEPTHKYFRAFCALTAPGALPLDRTKFSPLDDDLRVAMRNDLSIEAAASLLDRIVAIVVQSLPTIGPQDARIRNVCERLRREPNILLEDVAAELRISYDRASHLFTQHVGLTYRRYRLWCKLKFSIWLLESGETLTAAAHAAGFADLAHLSRTYQIFLGQSPSQLMRHREIEIHADIAQQATDNRHPLLSVAN